MSCNRVNSPPSPTLNCVIRYECAEQLSSRLLGVLALKDVLQAFKVKDCPNDATIEAKLTADLKKLKKVQHHNGSRRNLARL